MPRSDDWTIHMPPPPIKRAGRRGIHWMLCGERFQPSFASLCGASLNRLEISTSAIARGGFARANLTRNYFGDDDAVPSVAFRAQRPL
jgi:hypothetical protein